MKIKFVIILAISLISFTINAQTEQVKPVKFNIEKALANVEKISSQNVQVMFKGHIIEKLDNDLYWIKDDSGRLKIEIPNQFITNVGVYTETTFFYITVKVKDVRQKTFIATKLDKAE